MVSCQKGPTRHAYAWQIGPFWQDTLDIYKLFGWHYAITQDSQMSAILGQHPIIRGLKRCKIDQIVLNDD